MTLNKEQRNDLIQYRIKLAKEEVLMMQKEMQNFINHLESYIHKI